MIAAVLPGLVAEVASAAEPGLPRDAVFHTTDATEVPKGLALYGTFVGGDEFIGRGESAWGPVTGRMGLFVAGYPGQPGEELRVEWKKQDGTVATTVYRHDPPREQWVAWPLTAPPGSVAVRWVAADKSAAVTGWLGVSEFADLPWELRFMSARMQVLVNLGLVAVLSGCFGLAVAGRVRRTVGRAVGGARAEVLTPIMTTALLAVVGYGVFWVWFFSAKVGLVVSTAILVAGVVLAVYELRSLRPNKAAIIPWVMALGHGLFFAGLLMGPPAKSFAHAAANRLVGQMPVDNELPGALAMRLAQGLEPKNFLGDWLGSDRPPLQAGWDLVFWPAVKALKAEPITAHGVAGMWLQMAWVPAMWAVFQLLGLTRWQTAGATLALGSLAFMLMNSVYVWPKLSAGAFTLVGALLCLQSRKTAVDARGTYLIYGCGGLMLALGWLSHGGSAFALVGLVPWVLWDWRNWRGWTVAGAVFVGLGSAWVCYQKFYDPPGNRLLKWHLAGFIPVDQRGVVETLVAQYKKVGWEGALNARGINLHIQFAGDWEHMAGWEVTPFRRYCELSFYPRSAGWFLPVGLLAWVWLGLSRRRRARAGVDLRLAGLMAGWMLTTWAAWIGLMFIPLSATAHQGTYVIPFLLYALLLTAIFRGLGRLAPVLVAVQFAYLIAIWGPAGESYYKTLPEDLRPAVGEDKLEINHGVTGAGG